MILEKPLFSDKYLIKWINKYLHQLYQTHHQNCFSLWPLWASVPDSLKKLPLHLLSCCQHATLRLAQLIQSNETNNVIGWESLFTTTPSDLHSIQPSFTLHCCTCKDHRRSIISCSAAHFKHLFDCDLTCFFVLFSFSWISASSSSIFCLFSRPSRRGSRTNRVIQTSLCQQCFQLLLGGPGAFPNQIRYIICPVWSGSTPGSLTRWTCPENLQREATSTQLEP